MHKINLFYQDIQCTKRKWNVKP